MSDMEVVLGAIAIMWAVLFTISMFLNLMALRTIRSLLHKEEFLRRVLKNNGN